MRGGVIRNNESLPGPPLLLAYIFWRHLWAMLALT